MNLFWPVYKNLEKELLKITEIIHFDDKQIECYSAKFIDLLIRICVEIESLSKQLYLQEGGTKLEENKMYFDTVCLKYLEDKYNLSQKVLYVKNLNTFFESQENIEITPLKKSYKRGTSGSKWKVAYQGVKHDRINNYTKANVKNVILALGALFILNLYYKNQTFEIENSLDAEKFDDSIGSDFFIVKVNKDTTSLGQKIKDDITCIYYLHLREDIRRNFEEEQKKLSVELIKKICADKKIIQAINDGKITIDNMFEDYPKKIIEIIGIEGWGKYLTTAKASHNIGKMIDERKFVAYINKG